MGCNRIGLDPEHAATGTGQSTEQPNAAVGVQEGARSVGNSVGDEPTKHLGTIRARLEKGTSRDLETDTPNHLMDMGLVELGVAMITPAVVILPVLMVIMMVIMMVGRVPSTALGPAGASHDVHISRHGNRSRITVDHDESFTGSGTDTNRNLGRITKVRLDQQLFHQRMGDDTLVDHNEIVALSFPEGGAAVHNSRPDRRSICLSWQLRADTNLNILKSTEPA